MLSATSDIPKTQSYGKLKTLYVLCLSVCVWMQMVRDPRRKAKVVKFPVAGIAGSLGAAAAGVFFSSLSYPSLVLLQPVRLVSIHFYWFKIVCVW